MKNNNINLVFKTIRKKSMFNILFLLCIVFATFLPITLYGVSQSLINEVNEQNSKVYGNFTDIYYIDSKEYDIKGELTKDDISNVLKDYKYDDFGVIYNLGKTQVGDNEVTVGFIDEKAIELSNFRIIEGTYPKDKDEIILSFSLKNNLNEFDTITIENEQYKVVGYFDDIGTLWPKGKKQKNSGFKQVDVIISKEKAREIYSSSPIEYAQVLFDSDKNIKNSVENDENFYKNINLKTKENDVFSIPNEFLAIIYISAIVVLYNILNLSKNKIIKRFKIYNILGMEKKHIKRVYFLEYFILGLIGIVLGLLVGILINFGIMKVLNNVYNSELKLYFGKKYFLIVIMILSSVLINIVLFYILQFNKKDRGKVKNKKSESYKKTNILKLVLLEYKSNLSVVFSMTLLIIMSFIIIEYGLIYKKTFIENTEYIEVKGKMAHDFDYEFLNLPKNQNVQREGTVHSVDNYEKTGASEEILQKMKNEKIFKEVKAYREYNNLWVLVDKNNIDEYLDATDFAVDGEYTNYSVEDGTIFEIFDYGDLIPTQSKMIGYSKNELQDFEEFISSGEINVEKVESGEEIILMAPKFKISVLEDGGIQKNNIRIGEDKKEEKVYSESNFKVGDEIIISTIVEKSGNIGEVSSENAKDKLERIDKKVKIGGIIPYYIGWWENEVTIGESYYILTSNDAFEKMGFESTFSRIDIYKNENIDIKSTNNIVNKYNSDLPNMYLDSRTERLNDYHKLNIMIKLFVDSIIVFISLIVFTTISIQMLTKVKMNMYKYSLLRLNGMSIRKLSFVWRIQVVVIGIVGFVLAQFAVIGIVSFSDSLEGGKILDFISVLELGMVFIFIFTVLMFTTIPPVLFLRKSSLREGL